MNTKTFNRKRNPFLIGTILGAFLIEALFPVPGVAQLRSSSVLNLPAPGTMITVSKNFNPPVIKGMTIHPDNPFKFDFIIEPGDDHLDGEAFKQESMRLIKYFMAALTTPDEDMWVNLSPLEEDRIIPESLGITAMGRDLLAQDYMLKQLSSSLMYPDEKVGRAFWEKVYQAARDMFGTTEVPVNTFNKIWIIPDESVVYEHNNSVFVGEKHLKVMLEQDYMALKASFKKVDGGRKALEQEDAEAVNRMSSEIVRDVLIPEIEKEVNEGKTFANLRQIINSVILAIWYKKNLRESLLGKAYVDQNKVKGIDIEDKEIKEKALLQNLWVKG